MRLGNFDKFKKIKEKQKHKTENNDDFYMF